MLKSGSRKLDTCVIQENSMSSFTFLSLKNGGYSIREATTKEPTKQPPSISKEIVFIYKISTKQIQYSVRDVKRNNNDISQERKTETVS